MDRNPIYLGAPARRRAETETAPVQAIEALVQRIASSPIQKMERMVKGKSNEVYTVTVTSGEKFVVRISRDTGYSRLREEQWVLEQCLQAGISVPKVLLIDTMHIGGVAYNASIESELPGTPFDEVGTLTNEEKRSLLTQAGGILARIHSIPVEGFGLFDEYGKGRYSSVQEVFTDLYIGKAKMLEIAKATGFDEAVLLRAFEIMERGAVSYPSIKPHLVHNDFEPKHILVEDQKVVGILDFEMAEGGDPILDFARWHFSHKDSYEVNDLMAGYTDREIFSRNFDFNFNLWRIYVGIGKLAHTYQEKDQEGIAFAMREITNDVNYWFSELQT
ncbi:MAG: phosphotransferase [Patescibacteria group bacterium]